MTLPGTDVVDRLARVHARIAAAGGDPDRVKVVAVTKGFDAGVVGQAVAAGLHEVGENYAQELLAKAADVSARASPSGWLPCWHFLGPVQRNKVPSLATTVSVWQAVDRLVAGQAIAKHAPGAAVLVQVNTSDDPLKSGCRPEEAPALLDGLVAAGLHVRGLMTIGPLGPPEMARPGFAALARLADRLGLVERSMGMTNDLEVAVQEGATMLRIGTALFGPRPPAGDLRR